MKHAISFVETNSMREKTLRKKIRTPKVGFGQIMLCNSLEIRSLWCSWERNDVPDVLHSRHEEHQSLEAQAEACVRA